MPQRLQGKRTCLWQQVKSSVSTVSHGFLGEASLRMHFRIANEHIFMDTCTVPPYVNTQFIVDREDRQQKRERFRCKRYNTIRVMARSMLTRGHL